MGEEEEDSVDTICTGGFDMKVLMCDLQYVYFLVLST